MLIFSLNFIIKNSWKHLSSWDSQVEPRFTVHNLFCNAESVSKECCGVSGQEFWKALPAEGGSEIVDQLFPVAICLSCCLYVEEILDGEA